MYVHAVLWYLFLTYKQVLLYNIFNLFLTKISLANTLLLIINCQIKS